MADLMGHPSDLDLLEYLESVLDEAAVERVESHLAECLVCRVSLDQMRRSSPFPLPPPIEVPDVSFWPLRVEDLPGTMARPGELWLTASDVASMVLVRAAELNAERFTVVPVVRDVEVVDRSARILDDTVSPIGEPIAIYDRLVVTVPPESLAQRIVPLRDVDLLTLVDGDGVRHGTKLEGPGDPRHEFRQHLIDALTALDPHADAQVDDLDEPRAADAVLEELREGLVDFGRTDCVVEELRSLPASQPGWRPIARVSEFDSVVIVIATPAGLTDRTDHDTARRNVTRLAASALAILHDFGESVDLYDPAGLSHAFVVPEGRRTDAPLIEGLPIVEILAKYFDSRSAQAFTPWTSGDVIGSIDVNAVLARNVSAAVTTAIAAASRYGAEKKEGFRRLEGTANDITDALAAAFSPEFDPSLILDVIEGDG